MDRKPDIVYNSETARGTATHQLASGYISQTVILFEKEAVTAVVQAEGSVEFFGGDGALIAAGQAPAVVSGKECYTDIGCQVKDGRICLLFPVYKWIDNYPHCDGEHDRWDTRIVDWHPLTLDPATGTVE